MVFGLNRATVSPCFSPYLFTKAVDKCVVWVLISAIETRSFVTAFVKPRISGSELLSLWRGEWCESKSQSQIVISVGTLKA